MSDLEENNGFSKLSEVLNVENKISTSDIIPSKTENSDIVVSAGLTSQEIDFETHFKEDYHEVRNNLKDIIKNGAIAIDGILRVSSETDKPSAYQVLGELITTVSNANKELIELHKKVKEIKKIDININMSPTNVTNQSIFVGSTKELQTLLKKQKEEMKKIDEELSILDKECKENEKLTNEIIDEVKDLNNE